MQIYHNNQQKYVYSLQYHLPIPTDILHYITLQQTEIKAALLQHQKIHMEHDLLSYMQLIKATRKFSSYYPGNVNWTFNNRDTTIHNCLEMIYK